MWRTVEEVRTEIMISDYVYIPDIPRYLIDKS